MVSRPNQGRTYQRVLTPQTDYQRLLATNTLHGVGTCSNVNLDIGDRQQGTVDGTWPWQTGIRVRLTPSLDDRFSDPDNPKTRQRNERGVRTSSSTLAIWSCRRYSGTESWQACTDPTVVVGGIGTSPARWN